MNKWKWNGDGEVEVQGVTKMMNALKPESSRKRKDAFGYNDIAHHWLSRMPLAVIDKRRFSGNQYGEQISLDELRNQFNYRYNHNGKTLYWFDWFRDNFPLWREITKGTNIKGRNTEVIITFDMLRAFGLIDAEAVVEAWETELKKLRKQNPDKDYKIDWIKIDLENLQRYIKQTEETIRVQQHKKQTDARTNQMEINLIEAKIIEAFAVGYGQEDICPMTGVTRYLVPQVYYEHKYMRRRYYVSSINLQNLHSKLREVLTGYGWAVDLNSSVWSFYRLLCDWANIESSTIDMLIENKDSFRKSVGDVLHNTYTNKRAKTVKTAITALGFGANPTAFGAIDKIIKNSDDLKAFNSHPYIQDLIRIQRQLTDWIKIEYADEIAVLRNDPEFTVGRNFNYKKFMAKLYQNYETVVMEELIQFLEDSGSEVVLWVHDGVYVRNKRPDPAFDTLVIKQYNRYARAEIKNIESQVYTNPLQHIEENEHKLLIAAEELKAKKWAAELGIKGGIFGIKTPMEVLNEMRKNNQDLYQVDDEVGEYSGNKNTIEYYKEAGMTDYIDEYLAEFYGEDQ